jgi:hypothetical protein
MKMNRFKLSYYTGEEFDRPQLKEFHDSIMEAARWCQRNYVPLAVVEITEWDTKDDSTLKALGSCSLEDAYENQMESLPN